MFLLLYGVLCAWLELSGKVLFANWAGFLLLLATPWVWWMHVAGQGGLTRLRGTLALLVRLSLVGLFAMLMAEPRAVRSSDKISVVYALDVSDSIGEESTDAALRFVSQTVSEKPEQDEAGLVVFGRNAAVELPPRITFPFEAINSRIDRDATNSVRIVVAGCGHAARREPRPHRPCQRRHSNRRRSGPRPGRTQVAGGQYRRLADPIQLRRRSMAGTIGAAAIREDRRELRSGHRALFPAGRIRHPGTERERPRNLSGGSLFSIRQEPLCRSHLLARAGLLRIRGNDSSRRRIRTI